MRSAVTANAPMRSENCSRTSEMSPSPVYAPSRAHISCTTTSATVTSTMTKSIEYSNSDPADANVVIPPASLPALAAMTPGPEDREDRERPDDATAPRRGGAADRDRARPPAAS